MCSLFLVLVKSLAAEFCMSCNFFIDFFGETSKKCIALILPGSNKSRVIAQHPVKNGRTLAKFNGKSHMFSIMEHVFILT